MLEMETWDIGQRRCQKKLQSMAQNLKKTIEMHKCPLVNGKKLERRRVGEQTIGAKGIINKVPAQ